MQFRRIGQLVAATTVSAVALSGAQAVAQENKTTISVTNITDIHGHLEDKIGDPAKAGDEIGVARLQSLIKQVNEGQEFNLTSSGDNVGGSAFVSAISDDKYTLEALNEMGMKVTAVGNHEFDKGTEDLTGRIADSSDYPILGANVFKDGKPLLEASHVEEIDGVKVGYVGTVTENTKYKVSAAKIPGITFTNPAEATNKEATRLKESGEADVVVALMHEDAQGFAEDFNKDVDVAFGGDTHVATKGEIEREGALPLQWAQGHEYGKLLNDVDITFDKTAKKITDISLKQYDATAAAKVEPDAEIAAIVKKAQQEAGIEGAKTAGTVERALFRGSDENADSGSNRGVESTLNNFIADGQRYAMSKQVGEDIEIGVMNAGGVRADLKGGDVTYKDIFEVQPFGNSVITAKISGEEFINALENQWQEGSRPRLAMGLSNNVQVVYDQKAGKGERVKSVTINGEPIDPKKDYSIALSSFLASSDEEAGGDGYFNAGSIKDKNDVGYMDTQAMIDYIKSGESEVRTGQGQIGAHVEGDVKPGEEITVNLSSLNYSTEGEPMAKKATVKLGDAEQTVDIDNAAQEGDAQFGERGRATVKLTVPENLSGTQNLEITTDAGTKATLPLEVSGDGSEEPGAKPAPKGSSLSSNGSSVGGAVFAIVAALVAGVAVVGMNPQILPAPARKMIEDLRKQFHI
ncbi:bifunctional metallophosphatase/5'-nucleotidase [Corynebacterium tuberculostearicum]|uniref:bifunctional metallophosphatase/5'-nucleotidase n=1 Tax=Corynebacterium tuberculostearicum TaxID=38304 RepID=UPI0020272D1D|nr:bifunctional UDP-sugar hydrolase/5'-nucleotidase [Corynebacterium tuberculostearicum]MCG7454265.1 bifunctional metallophosphatase/5'-nucleotidase [Corynebacterium tuberculostearicum]